MLCFVALLTVESSLDMLALYLAEGSYVGHSLFWGIFWYIKVSALSSEHFSELSRFQPFR